MDNTSIGGYHRKSGLAPREFQVWSLIAQGLNNVSIAKVLGIDATAVHPYVSRIYRYLGFDGAVYEKGDRYDKRVRAALLWHQLMGETMRLALERVNQEPYFISDNQQAAQYRVNGAHKYGLQGQLSPIHKAG